MGYTARMIRVKGRVQGVGFRPAVWRIATELGLGGYVLNDGEGVAIGVGGDEAAVNAFIPRLLNEQPPLARIDRVETSDFAGELPPAFAIVESGGGGAHTQVAPDAVVCRACAGEVLDPADRRFRYPFANCTHCGPRLTIVKRIPYDRASTTMDAFPLCDACLSEYRDPADRRFHAEPIACPVCGPKARLVRLDGGSVELDLSAFADDTDAARSLIARGEVVAIKGLGGYHLACDAACAGAVRRLRSGKRRNAKPFALMARDLDVIRRYATVTAAEEAALRSPEGPIVLLRAEGPERLPDDVAPGLKTLGFMLPTTPLHLLIMRELDRPAVMTSGNLSEEPPVIGDDEARTRLGGAARYALTHNREIANRVDDSIVRFAAGAPRVLRRARGYAAAPMRLPPGFEATPELLAMGGELKTTFCLVKDGEAVLSQHIGNLDNVASFKDYRKNLALYADLFEHRPVAVAADLHPEYQSAKLARRLSADTGLELVEVQHHHAHVAACLAENGRPLGAPPVLGVALDGLGWGDDGAIWGGEFLLADYAGYQRLGTFRPVAMPGAAQASREPWRNLYAHLMAAMGWEQLEQDFAGLETCAYLAAKPRATLDAMIARNVNSPLASSCGRLFDAAAAALGLSRERQDYEGQAAAQLESAVDLEALRRDPDNLAYAVEIATLSGSWLACIEPRPMWRELLEDLKRRTRPSLIAARFHKGLAMGVAAMAERLAWTDGHQPGTERRFDTVALSGGCFQNRVLLEETIRRLEAAGFSVLTHAAVPANDGGLALGQAAVAAARLGGRRLALSFSESPGELVAERLEEI